MDQFLHSLIQWNIRDVFDLDEPGEIDALLWTKFSTHVRNEMSQIKDFSEDGRLCIIIDDNMYYRSMRYVYYQLARKRKFTQVQVLLICRIYEHNSAFSLKYYISKYMFKTL